MGKTTNTQVAEPSPIRTNHVKNALQKYEASPPKNNNVGKRSKPPPPKSVVPARPPIKVRSMVPAQSHEPAPSGKRFGKCAECGALEKGKVDDSDGSFYCNSCWANY